MAGAVRTTLTPGLGCRCTDDRICLAEGAVTDQNGNLFVADIPRRQVRKLSPGGSVLVVLGPSELSVPAGLAVDSAGSLFIADSRRQRVLRLATDGSVTRVAGTGVAGLAGDGGPAPAAQLKLPILSTERPFTGLPAWRCSAPCIVHSKPRHQPLDLQCFPC
jgi:NHL repeat